MIRYLLDTNIISNVTKPAPSEALLAWMGEQVDENLFIASLTVAEIRRGILEKPARPEARPAMPGFPARKARQYFSQVVYCHLTRGRA